MKNIFKPILFSTPMVQALLQGKKTQTRRIINPQPYKVEDFIVTGLTENKKAGTILRHPKKGKYDGIFIVSAPKLWPAKYQVGDILWVRETFGKLVTNDSFVYAADVFDPKTDKPYFGWKPSIHMPKEAARIFLYVTNVRVERLQDISEADAIAEGIEKQKTNYGDYLFKHYLKDKFGPSAKHSFQTLWQKIYGIESWNENPYVWVYDFEVIEKPKDFI